MWNPEGTEAPVWIIKLDVEKIWITELYKKNSKIIEQFGEKKGKRIKKIVEFDGKD